MTHSELIEVAYNWALNNGDCEFAFKEFHTHCKEHPDVIGMQSWGRSLLIECKVSRSDFIKDKQKIFRVDPKLGMGTYRYFCCPRGLIKLDELPNGWGLIYVSDSLRPRCVLGSEIHEKSILDEHRTMVIALRRLHLNSSINSIYPTIGKQNNLIPQTDIDEKAINTLFS